MTTQRTAEIPVAMPNHVHFVWYGTGFPFMNRLAIESALAVCRPERVTLWHADPLGELPHLAPLRRWPAFETRRLESAALFPDDPAGGLPAAALRRVYDGVSSPVARSNLARAGVLHRHGGLYLDMDTLVLRDLAPLRRFRGFMGTERVVWPGERKQRVDSYRLLVGPALSVLRWLAARAPGGERVLLGAARWYPREVNGAVMGFAAGHPFLAYLLELSAGVPEREWGVPHRLGTHLLQHAVKHYAGGGLELLDTECFYPLGPVASAHYFRPKRDLEGVYRRVVSERTYAVHWYASVTALDGFGPEQIRREAGRTLFARLCAPYAAGPPAAS
jgi:hypothetical protein